MKCEAGGARLQTNPSHAKAEEALKGVVTPDKKTLKAWDPNWSLSKLDDVPQLQEQRRQEEAAMAVHTAATAVHSTETAQPPPKKSSFWGFFSPFK